MADLRIRRLLMAAALSAATVFCAVDASLALAAENTCGVAVIIGNQEYRSDLPKVEFARNDATVMKKFVVEGLGFRECNVIDLSDATQAEMEAAFGNERTYQGKLWRWLQPGTFDVVVYYSGHGVPGRDGERGYLLPVNADPDAPEAEKYLQHDPSFSVKGHAEWLAGFVYEDQSWQDRYIEALRKAGLPE